MLRTVLRHTRIVLKTLIIVAIAVTIVPAAMIGVGVGFAVFSPAPVTIPKPRTFPPIQASHVYDVYGNEIAEFKEFDSKIPMRKEDVPLVLKQAVISAEDKRFYSHNGVDLIGTLRALRADAKKGTDATGSRQGGSTITQQFVKILYETNAAVAAADAATRAGSEGVDTQVSGQQDNGKRTLTNKLHEAILATRLNRKISKDDILFGYLSNIFLGEGAFGMEAASQTYFRKSVKHLTLSESATLAGIINAPSQYEPRNHPKAAEFKRQSVLHNMRQEGYISRSEELRAIDQKIWVETQGPPPIGQPVTLVFGRANVNSTYPYFVDYVRRYLVAKYGEDKVRRGGLQVQTTIDPKLQAEAEKAAANTLEGTKAPLEMAVVSVEPLTGFVKAMVGGRDYYAEGGQVNLALGGCPKEAKLAQRLGHQPAVPPVCNGSTYGGGTGRSPGSSMKPIVLATAFSQGINPATVYEGSPFQPKCAKRPIKNFEGAAYSAVDLRTATIKSVNTVYARLGMDVGIGNVAKMAQKLGLESVWYDPKVHCASWAIGGIDVSPLEMAAAYSVFAGRGLRAEVTPVVRVVDGKGNVIEDNTGNHTVQALSQNIADNVNDILQAVVSSGTGVRAALKDRPAAGKTGTSQGAGNVWFVGYTPTLSTAIWMGYRDAPRPLRNIKGVGSLTGGSFPALTWHNYMTDALADVPPTGFTAPAPIKKVQIVNRLLILAKRARKGIDPGARRSATKTGVSSYEEGIGSPSVDAPAYIAPPTTTPPPPTAPPLTIETPLATVAPEPPLVTAPISVVAATTPAVNAVAGPANSALPNVAVVTARTIPTQDNALAAIATVATPAAASGPAASLSATTVPH